MCGRYYIEEKMKYDLENWVIVPGGHVFKYGDLHPGDEGFIIMAHYQGAFKTWGYPFHGQLMFNARIESCLNKTLFREDAIYRRCVVPVSGFYEWDEKKTQYRFKTGQTMYLAGLYHDDSYTILTKKGEEILQGIHSRMPVIISSQDIDMWLEEGKVHKKTQDALEKEILSSYVQLSFFD